MQKKKTTMKVCRGTRKMFLLKCIIIQFQKGSLYLGSNVMVNI